MPAFAVTFYNVVLWVHIAAVVVGLGATFSYGFLYTSVARRDPRALPALHRAIVDINQRLVSPSLIVILAAGIYLANKLDSFSEFYVSFAFVALIVIGGVNGAFFIPRDRRLAEIAERDIAAAGDGEVTMSAEYREVSRQVAIVGAAVGVLIVLTVYVMTAKPFL